MNARCLINFMASLAHRTSDWFFVFSFDDRKPKSTRILFSSEAGSNASSSAREHKVFTDFDDSAAFAGYYTGSVVCFGQGGLQVCLYSAAIPDC